ncbi:MAG: bifunctional metallophosphatase/5'-nucleotidase [Bacteroidetes bacterium]|nr:bifunctional metallophosphatase/5'-nucleotidase [Bacteroidota bacterium]
MKKFIIPILALLVACTSTIERPDSYELVLVGTSDVHGAIFNYDFIHDKPSQGSLAQVNKYVNELREENNVILMDNGDILQGQPVVYYSNFEDTMSKHICAKVMNYMDYDVASVGNHDIEAGHDVYDKLKDEFNFPWLAANAVNKSDGKPYFKPYTIINKSGIKIAVLGLITPAVPNWLPEELWSGMEFEDMVVSAKKWVPHILEKEKPDLMVGLFHAGFEYDYGNQNYDTYKNENASVIVAEQVPGFDIIFVGHDHKSWNEIVKDKNGNEVVILGPRSSARQVMKATVQFTLNDKNQYDKNIQGSIVEMTDIKPDSVFNHKFKDEFDKVKSYVSRQIGDFQQPIYTQKALFGPSEFVDFIQEIQLELSNADISFTAPLSFNAVIEKGPVYVRDMFKLYKYENFLYTINLTGKEIDQYLEYSFGNWFNTMNSPNDHLLKFKRDDKGNLEYSERYDSYELENTYYNFDVASGIKYVVDIRKPQDKVNIISLSNGNEFYLDSTYTVAINSYRGNGGGGHLIRGVGLSREQLLERRISSTDKDLRYYMMEWIEEKGSVNPKLKNEWTIYPADWWEKAKQKDKKLLN